MKVPALGGMTDKLEFWIGVGIAAVIVMSYLGKKSLDAAKTIGNAVDPTSTGNIFYSGANAVGAVVADDPSFSLGGWIYSATHPDPTKLPDPPQDKRLSTSSSPGLNNTPNTTADPYATPVDISVPGGGYPIF
jgi:hypothetical protein